MEYVQGYVWARMCFDPDQPQNFLGDVNTADPQSLLNPRPDVNPGRGFLAGILFGTRLNIW